MAAIAGVQVVFALGYLAGLLLIVRGAVDGRQSIGDVVLVVTLAYQTNELVFDTVFVSHRFSTVRMADLIVVVADGRVVEQGSHDELTERGGLYADLFTLQASAFG